MVMIFSHGCPCWDLKGERLSIHYHLPENHTLQGIRVVSFIRFSNSLINNDSFDLNMGEDKQQNDTSTAELITRRLAIQCCSEGTQTPPVTQTKNHKITERFGLEKTLR